MLQNLVRPNIVAPSGRHRSRVPFAEFWRLELAFPESAGFWSFVWWTGGRCVLVTQPSGFVEEDPYDMPESDLSYENTGIWLIFSGSWEIDIFMTARSGKHVVLRGQKSQQMMRKSAPIRCWKHPAKPGLRILVWFSPSGKFQHSRSREGVPGWPWMKGDKSKRINKIKKIDVYIVLRMNKNHHKIQVRRSMMVKSIFKKKTMRWRHLGSPLWPKAQREVNTLMSNCLAAWRREVLQMVTLTLWSLCYGWASFRNPAGTTSPRRAMVMAKKVHQAEIGVKGTVDVS